MENFFYITNLIIIYVFTGSQTYRPRTVETATLQTQHPSLRCPGVQVREMKTSPVQIPDLVNSVKAVGTVPLYYSLKKQLFFVEFTFTTFFQTNNFFLS